MFCCFVVVACFHFFVYMFIYFRADLDLNLTDAGDSLCGWWGKKIYREFATGAQRPPTPAAYFRRGVCGKATFSLQRLRHKLFPHLGVRHTGVHNPRRGRVDELGTQTKV